MSQGHMTNSRNIVSYSYSIRRVQSRGVINIKVTFVSLPPVGELLLIYKAGNKKEKYCKTLGSINKQWFHQSCDFIFLLVQGRFLNEQSGVLYQYIKHINIKLLICTFTWHCICIHYVFITVHQKPNKYCFQS